MTPTSLVIARPEGPKQSQRWDHLRPRRRFGFGVSRDTVAVAALAVFLFFAATNLQAGWMYAIDALLVGILVAAWVSARWSVRGLVVTRTVQPEVHEGDLVGVQLELRTQRLPGFFLEIIDQAAGLDARSVRMPVLWPGRPVVLRYMSVPAHRGVFTGGTTRIVSSGLTGWFRASRVIEVSSALTVLPRIWRLGRFRLPARSQDEYTSPRPARTGLEVSGVRHYREGDSLRHVHWRSTARRGRLVVREYDRDTDEPALLLLDARSPGGVSADAAETFEDLVRAAASVADALAANGRAVRVAGSINGTPAEAGPSRRTVLHWLAAIGEDGAVAPSRVYEAVCAPGTPVVVFTSDPHSIAYFEARGIPHAAVIAREGDDLQTRLTDMSLRGQADMSLRGQADMSLRGQADLSLRGQADLSLRGQADLSLRGQADLSLRGPEARSNLRTGGKL